MKPRQDLASIQPYEALTSLCGLPSSLVQHSNNLFDLTNHPNFNSTTLNLHHLTPNGRHTNPNPRRSRHSTSLTTSLSPKPPPNTPPAHRPNVLHPALHKHNRPTITNTEPTNPHLLRRTPIPTNHTNHRTNPRTNLPTPSPHKTRIPQRTTLAIQRPGHQNAPTRTADCPFTRYWDE